MSAGNRLWQLALSKYFYYSGVKEKYPQILVQFHVMSFFKTGIAMKLPNKIELKLKHMILYSKFLLLLSICDHGYNGGGSDFCWPGNENIPEMNVSDTN